MHLRAFILVKHLTLIFERLKDPLVVQHVGAVTREVMQSILTKSVVVLLQLANIAVLGEDRLALDTVLLQKIAQNHIIVPRQVQKLNELPVDLPDPLSLDENPTVTLENIERDPVLPGEISVKI
jgi:hypothetical protein